MERIRLLREQLRWSQKRMGDYLGVAQSAVFRMENGQRERGSVAKLLDQLQAEVLHPPEAKASSSPQVPAPAAAE